MSVKLSLQPAIRPGNLFNAQRNVNFTNLDSSKGSLVCLVYLVRFVYMIDWVDWV